MCLIVWLILVIFELLYWRRKKFSLRSGVLLVSLLFLININIAIIAGFGPPVRTQYMRGLPISDWRWDLWITASLSFLLVVLLLLSFLCLNITRFIKKKGIKRVLAGTAIDMALGALLSRAWSFLKSIY